MARALYSRCEILVLDDLFSSLDQKTRFSVAAKLLSTDGHAKTYRTTVIFTTQSGKRRSYSKVGLYLTVLAALVKFAETVLALEAGGSLVFNGSSEDWLAEKKHHKVVNLLEEGPDLSDTIETSENDIEPLKISTAKSAAEEEEQIRRQVGDASLWWYYFGTFGYLNLLVVMFCTIAAVLASNFPRRSSQVAFCVLALI